MAKRRYNRRAARRVMRGRYRKNSYLQGLIAYDKYKDKRDFYKKLTDHLNAGRGSEWSRQTFGRTWNDATDYQRWMRKKTRFRGEGDYWSDFKRGGWFKPNAGMGSALRGLGGAIGSYAGGPGAALGTAAGGAVSKWLGFGDYTTPASGNQLMGDAQTPITVNASDDNTGDLYISHTEFIGNVTASATGAGSSAFQQTVYELNPGLVNSFPWLSQIASNFELYDFQGLMFQYKPNSGESSTISNNLGKVIMATQYDPSANPFLNSVEMQNYDYANSTKPSCGLVHGVETALSQQAVNMMYIRTGSVTRDKIFTDLGKFIVATEGVPFSAAGSQILGELWVTYRVKLSRATLYSSLLGLTIPFDNIIGSTGTANSILGTTQVSNPNNANVWKLSSTASTNLTITGPANLSAGCYLFCVQITPGANGDTCELTTISYSSAVASVKQGTGSLLPGAAFNLEADKLETPVINNANYSLFVTVNNTSNIAPSVTLTFSPNTPNRKVTFFATQINCAIMDTALTNF